MEFDESKAYTALNADKLEPGDVVFVADTKTMLKKFDVLRLSTIDCILSEDCSCRFRITDNSSWALAYLIAKYDDPYKEFKKAQAGGKEVWFRDYDGNWKSNKDRRRGWFFSEPVEQYALTKPEVVMSDNLRHFLAKWEATVCEIRSENKACENNLYISQLCDKLENSMVAYSKVI